VSERVLRAERLKTGGWMATDGWLILTDRRLAFCDRNALESKTYWMSPLDQIDSVTSRKAAGAGIHELVVLGRDLAGRTQTWPKLWR